MTVDHALWQQMEDLTRSQRCIPRAELHLAAAPPWYLPRPARIPCAASTPRPTPRPGPCGPRERGPRGAEVILELTSDAAEVPSASLDISGEERAPPPAPTTPATTPAAPEGKGPLYKCAICGVRAVVREAFGVLERCRNDLKGKTQKEHNLINIIES